MNLKQAYEMGKDSGYYIASTQIVEFEGDDRDEFISQVCEHECEIYRQYSPFEFDAKEFNESRDPDRTWEEYERGVMNGAKLVWKNQRA